MSSRKHHHHHHSSRHLKKKRKRIILITSIILVVLVAVAAAGYWRWKSQERYNLAAEKSYDSSNDYHILEYQGKKYEYNNLVTSILISGIDSEGPMMANRSYAKAPRSDSVQVLVLDKRTNKMTIIALNRDTITPVRSYDAAGNSLGVYDNLLSLAFGFGTGGKSSCENLREAVSTLLGGIPINEYIIGNISTLPWVNQLVGGVTVTIPNDDLIEENPEFYTGNTVTLTDDWIEPFLRTRDTDIDYSNQGRMERQKAFITSFANAFIQRLQKDTSGVWKATEEMDGYIQTSITKNKYINLANTVGQMDFEEIEYYQPEGAYIDGQLHDEYELDQDALMQKLIELYYIEA